VEESRRQSQALAFAAFSKSEENMNKGKILSCAAFLILGLVGAAFAQGQSGGRPNEQQGASGRSVGTGGDNTDSSYSPGNPSPNDQIGDHPSSGDDKRGYDSDDAH
jgi:hypothetical protein